VGLLHYYGQEGLESGIQSVEVDQPVIEAWGLKTL
jgi:hypothetical protein